jgi:hypothetical protein
VGGQAKIVVRGQVDDLLAVEGADRGLLVFEHPQLEVRAPGLEFVELVGEIRKRVGAGSNRHERPHRFRTASLRGKMADLSV